MRARIQVLHLCGKMAPEESQAELVRLGVQGRAYSFFERMDLAYALTDLAIGRAGATFLAEVEAKGIPAILVPYPFAGGHQMENARAFARKTHALIIEQKDLNAGDLSSALRVELERLDGPRARANAVPEENPRVRLAEFILSFAKER